MAGAGTRRGKALYQEALAQLTAGSLFRSSEAGDVPEVAPVADEPEQPPVAEDEPELGGLLVDEGEPAPESELPAPALEHRNLSVLERRIALRVVYGRGYA